MKRITPVLRYGMRVNPIYKNMPSSIGNYTTKPPVYMKTAAKSDVFSPSRTLSFGSMNSRITTADLNEIVRLIQDSDEARLDGTVQKLYEYGDFMVKAPGISGNDTPLKEFFALVRAANSPDGITMCPAPAAISGFGERRFLVEEYLKGTKGDERLSDFDMVTKAVKALTGLDKTGIVNHELNPSNIILTPDGQIKLIDFDDFSFVSETGKVFRSNSTAHEYFVERIPQTGIMGGVSPAFNGPRSLSKRITPEQIFANSFAYKRKIPSGVQELGMIRNFAENPYISAPSNIANFEAETVYKALADSKVEEPIEYVRSYLQMKSKVYHASMRDFLSGLSVSPEACKAQGTLSLEEAQAQLKRAAEYEGFLAKLFDEKPDAYFAKLQAAKMQLGALLGKTDLDRGISNQEQIHGAYDKLIKIIMDGIDTYKEPDYQRYLKTELEKYTEAFSGTDFSVTPVKQKVLKSLDIVGSRFSDPAVDGGSFAALKDKAKIAGLRVAQGFGKNAPDPGQLTFTQEQRNEVINALNGAFGDLGGRVPEANFTRAVDDMAEEIMAEVARKAKESAARAAETAGDTVSEAAQTAKDAVGAGGTSAASNAGGVVAKHVKRVFESAESAGESFLEHAAEYQNNKYIKQGNKLFKGLGVMLAVAGFMAFEYFSYKKTKNSLEKEAAQSLNPFIKPDYSVALPDSKKE